MAGNGHPDVPGWSFSWDVRPTNRRKLEADKRARLQAELAQEPPICAECRARVLRGVMAQTWHGVRYQKRRGN